MKRFSHVALALAVGVLFAAPAHAVSFGFTGITNNNAGDIAIGEAQLSVDVTDGGGGLVNFLFANSGPEASSVASIYFDDQASLFGGISFTNGGGVNYVPGAQPAVLPGGNDIGFGIDFAGHASAPPPANGINPGESFTIAATLLGGLSLQDVLDALALGGNQAGSLRVGMHVIAFDSGGSESFVTTPTTVVPLPAAGLLLISGLAGLGFVSRRRKAA